MGADGKAGSLGSELFSHQKAGPSAALNASERDHVPLRDQGQHLAETMRHDIRTAVHEALQQVGLRRRGVQRQQLRA